MRISSQQRVEQYLNFLKKIETDSSSILYHTRIFDSLLIEKFAGLDVGTRSYEFDIYIPELPLNLKIWNFFIMLKNYCPILEIPMFIFVSVVSINTLTPWSPLSILISFFKNIFYYSKSDYTFSSLNFNFSICEYFISFSDSLSSVFSHNKLFNIYFNILFDFWLIFCEFLLVLFCLIHIYYILIHYEIISPLYISSIISFIKYCIPPIDIIISCTLFFGFIIFNMFNTIYGNPFNEIIAIYLFFAAVFILLIISICQDIFNFFCLSNISNNNIYLRILVYDVIYNFLNFFRVFLSWIRYLFYDLQLEWLDFTNHYVDFENETLLIDLNNIFNDNSSNNIFFIIFNKFFFIINFIFDICNLILILILNVFKFFMAFYIFWLIVDLFIMKIFGLREIKHNYKNFK